MFINTCVNKNQRKEPRMDNDRAKLLERAANAKRESKALDFKSEFDTASAPEWSEIIKDIVAFANSGGGVLVFGVNNDGSSAGNDISNILSIDSSLLVRVRTW